MTGGNVVNQPKSSHQRKLNRQRRIKRAQNKKQKGKGKFKRNQVDELTTKHVLKKVRTNPKANIKLSGKKKRLILKDIKRKQKQESQMQVDVTRKSVKEGKRTEDEMMDVE